MFTTLKTIGPLTRRAGSLKEAELAGSKLQQWNELPIYSVKKKS